MTECPEEMFLADLSECVGCVGCKSQAQWERLYMVVMMIVILWYESYHFDSWCCFVFVVVDVVNRISEYHRV